MDNNYYDPQGTMPVGRENLHANNVPYGYAQNRRSQKSNNAPHGYVPAPDPEGKKNADIAMWIGIIGIFFFTLIFGIIALVYANKAEKAGVEAKAGKILGWIDIVWGTILTFIFFIGIGAGIVAA